MQSEKKEIDSFDSHFSDLFRNGIFSISHTEIVDRFYWLSSSELAKRLSALVVSGRVVQIGEQYSFGVFVKTLNKLYDMFLAVNNQATAQSQYSLNELLTKVVGVVHVVSSDVGEVLTDLIKAPSVGKVFLISQSSKALRPYAYSANVVTKTFAELFTNEGQLQFLNEISPNDKIVVLDGNFMTLFLLYICMAALTQERVSGLVALYILHDENYDAGVFAGGFLKTLYSDLEIPQYRFSSTVRQNVHLLREFVDGGEFFKFCPLDEGAGDRQTFLDLFKVVDSFGLNIVSDMTFLSTVETGRFSVQHIKWVMGEILTINGLQVINCHDTCYFIGEKIRSKADAVRINYADEYEIVSYIDGFVGLRSLQDNAVKKIGPEGLEHYVSSSFIHVSDIAHQYYENGLLLVPLAGLHAIDDMDLLRFISCFRGQRFIVSQKVFLAHALSNRGARRQSVYKCFIY